MFSELILIHRSGSQTPLIQAGPGSKTEVGAAAFASAYPLHSLHTFFFKTCLRQIAIVDSEAAANLTNQLGPEDEVFRGPDAYQFLLEVICGLRSPLVGETEVSGQFKLAVAAFAVPANPWGQQIKRMFQNLFEDAKRIRQKHLVDLGSQSYGSVLRREFKRLPTVKTIHVLGAGHLVQEILPWIAKDGIQVHVHCRNPEKARSEIGKQTVVAVHSLEETVSFKNGDAFVVAAPVTAEWIRSWIGAVADQSPEVIADLRADSHEDRLVGHSALECRVIDLKQVFNHISETQAHLEARKEAALKAIGAAVHERNCYVEYRPFGWEDVCA
jgi:glutamyl-tRNA reductase